MHGVDKPKLTPEGPKPEKPPRWRDLTDEQRWERIYADRKLKKARAPQTVQEAVALALPAYVMHQAIEDCSASFTANVRPDVHYSIVAAVAKVASLLRDEHEREAMANRLERHFKAIRSDGFYTDNREFLYANAVALVRLVDDYRYPPDSPCVGAAILLKEDAEEYNDTGDWGLSKTHALRMAGKAYDFYCLTGLYAYPTGKISG